MPRTIETVVYKFGELSDTAKEKALDEYRYRNHYPYEQWYEDVCEMVAEAADMIGIDLRGRKRKFMNGKEDNEGIDILFSGFSSQGDGACFNGWYYYNKGALAKVKKEFPEDTELHRIASVLQSVQRKAFYQLYAKVTPGPLSNHYSHYNTRTIEVYDKKELEYPQETWNEFEEGIDEALRDFMKWIYVKLEKEYDWLMSDEAVQDSIEANETEFNEDGTLA